MTRRETTTNSLGEYTMHKGIQVVAVVSSIVVLAAGDVCAREAGRFVVFREDFADRALPGWHGAKPATVKLSQTQGPGDIPA
ncbi:MAG: hypothetical protein ACC628_23065, partial [Pirellulaceae bacterium]